MLLNRSIPSKGNVMLFSNDTTLCISNYVKVDNIIYSFNENNLKVNTPKQKQH